MTRIANAGKSDAVYPDLHGAMVTEHPDDGKPGIRVKPSGALNPTTKSRSTG